MQEGELLNQRKEKVLSYLRERKDWFQYLILAIIIWIGASIRYKVIPNLKDVTTGQFISLELDSTLFLRYAREIVERGSLFTVDPFRFAPLGADISNLAVFTSYFSVYLYKVLHFFNSKVTVELAVNLYPVVAMMIMTVFLFLLVRRLFEWKTALLSCLLINVIPTFLFRSMGGSSDHDMLGMMLIIMAFYFYVCSWQARRIRYSLVFSGIAGLVTAVGAETAGSYTFVLMVIGVFSLVELFLTKFENKDFYVLTAFVGSFTIFYKLFNLQLAVSPLFTSITTGLAYLALVVAGVNFVVFKRNILNVKRFLVKCEEKIPEGILSIALGMGVSALGALVIFGPRFFVTKLNDLYAVVFKSFSYSRWALTVAENKTPFVADWFGQFGKAYVWLFVLGSILLFYDAVKSFKRAKYLTGGYAFFIFGYIFSRYSANSFLNGSSGFSKLWFYSAIVIFLGGMGYAYFASYRKKDPEFEKVKQINKRYAFMFTWFLLMILAASSAIRLLFEFSPVTSVIVAFVFVSVFDFAYKLKNVYVKGVTILVLVLVLFSPFASWKGLVMEYYEVSSAQAGGSGPGYNQQWQRTGAWVRENTPENAIFAHWWDYGYWVQEGFRRATITDGGNFFGWWNYLMGRNVLTGQSDEEALGFLFAHKATHLLMVADEVGKYPAYSSIGSDKEYDRYSWISTFGLDKQSSVEGRSETTLVYQGGALLDEDLIIEGKVYPANQAGIGAVIMKIKNREDGVEISQPMAWLVFQNQRVDLPLRCVFVNGNPVEYKEFGIDACFRIIPVFESQTNVDELGAGLWLSKKVYHSRFGQWYLLNKESPSVKVVYDDAQQLPLSLYQGRMLGPMKIWEIKYPENFSISEEEREYFLRTSYADEELLKPR